MSSIEDSSHVIGSQACDTSQVLGRSDACENDRVLHRELSLVGHLCYDISSNPRMSHAQGHGSQMAALTYIVVIGLQA